MMELVWMLAFMLIPVWIPVIAVTFGAIFDRLRPSEPSELTQRMATFESAPKPQVRATARPASAS